MAGAGSRKKKSVLICLVDPQTRRENTDDYEIQGALFIFERNKGKTSPDPASPAESS
jgi:hypothetical protein